MTEPLLPQQPYRANPNAARDRLESEVRDLRDQLKYQSDQKAMLRKRMNFLFDLLVKVGRQGGEYHEACCGTGRLIVCVEDEMSAADLREMKEMDPAEFDEQFPDDCEDPNCFEGWFVNGGE